MQDTIDHINHLFHGRLVGTDTLKYHVSFVVSQLPADLQEYITQYCWFVGSMDDAWAYTFTGNDLADQNLIFLSDDLLAQSPEQIHYSIAHEIGHVVEGHRNSVFVRQSKEEITEQEKEADEFASNYFPKPY